MKDNECGYKEAVQLRLNKYKIAGKVNKEWLNGDDFNT